MSLDSLSGKILGCAIEVHRNTGPGLLESAYQQCLAEEFRLNGFEFRTEVEIPMVYKGIRLNCGFRADIIVEDLVLLELKSVENILPIHKAQVITYLKLSGLELGYLLNFNVTVMKKGIFRLVPTL